MIRVQNITTKPLLTYHLDWLFRILGRFVSSSNGKESACNVGDLGLIPGLGRSLEKEMATHSSILAWKIPWTEEAGRLQSMGSHRVGHEWVTSLHFTSQCSYRMILIGVKNPPTGKESACNARDLGLIPGWGRSLEKEMATHSSTLAWKTQWMEKPGRLQSTGSQRVGHDWATSTYLTSPYSSSI